MSPQVAKRLSRCKDKENQPPPIVPPPKQAEKPANSQDIAPPDSKLVCGRYRKEYLRVFQCRQCNAVLGDTLSLCGEDDNLACIVCVRVTTEVVIGNSLMVDLEGALAGSSYKPLSCSWCSVFLGFCLHSTYKHLAHLRSLFCLSKDKILCYCFDTQKTVPASELKFNFVDLDFKSKFADLKFKLVKAYVDMQCLTSQLKELQSQKAQKVKSEEQGKIATDEIEKNSAEGSETQAVLNSAEGSETRAVL